MFAHPFLILYFNLRKEISSQNYAVGRANVVVWQCQTMTAINQARPRKSILRNAQNFKICFEMTLKQLSVPLLLLAYIATTHKGSNHVLCKRHLSVTEVEPQNLFLSRC